MVCMNIPKPKSGLVRRIGYAFVPQLIRSRYFHDTVPPSKLYATSYLDGIRGIAAVLVMNRHYILAFSKRVLHGHDTSGVTLYTDLPIIRIFLWGQSLVPTFFVIGGYVNALRPLQLMQAGTSDAHGKVLQTISSALFRRFFRLYLPALTVIVVAMFLAYTGLYGPGDRAQEDRSLYDGFRDFDLPAFDTLPQQLSFLFNEWRRMLNFFDREYFFLKHNPHMWTLNFEFRSAIVLYVALLLVARAGDVVRLVLLFAIGCYCLFLDRWEYFCFLCGACINQFGLIRERQIREQSNDELPLGDDKEALQAPKRSWRVSGVVSPVILTLTVLAALWLMTAPMFEVSTAWGYVTLSKYLIYRHSGDPGRILPAYGICLLLLAIRSCEPEHRLRACFTRPLTQYLGKISYAVFLCHGPCMHLIGWLFPVMVWKVIGSHSRFTYVSGVIVGLVLNMLLTLIVADVFTREVDKRCVQFSRWLDDKVFCK